MQEQSFCMFFVWPVHILSIFFKFDFWYIIYMLQKDADPFKRDTVVLLLQDMFEVVTCDMMVNEIWLVYSLRW